LGNKIGRVGQARTGLSRHFQHEKRSALRRDVYFLLIFFLGEVFEVFFFGEGLVIFLVVFFLVAISLAPHISTETNIKQFRPKVLSSGTDPLQDNPIVLRYERLRKGPGGDHSTPTIYLS
jgi:hypothetical protein